MVLLAVAGCRFPTSDYMPLTVGQKWSYLVVSPQIKLSPELVVEQTCAVGGFKGFELSGPLGRSRLAWTDSRLIASQLGQTRFDPPVVLLDPDVPTKPILREITVSTPLAIVKATAKLTEEHKTIDVNGLHQPCIKTSLRITISNHNLDLFTWWVRGRGVVQQVQRTDGNQDVAMTLLDGPSR